MIYSKEEYIMYKLVIYRVNEIDVQKRINYV